MTREDILSVNVSHFSQPDFKVEDPDSIHPVGASHLREYLNIMYGKEMPEGDRERLLADLLHQALTNFSLSKELESVNPNDPLAFVSLWLKLAEPIIDAATHTGKYIEEKLDAMLAAKDKSEELPDLNNDFTYMLGMYDSGSFILSGILEIPHPRMQNQELEARSRSLVFPGQYLQTDRAPGGLKKLAMLLSALRYSDGPRLKAALQSGQILITNAEQYYKALQMILEET